MEAKIIAKEQEKETKKKQEVLQEKERNRKTRPRCGACAAKCR